MGTALRLVTIATVSAGLGYVAVWSFMNAWEAATHRYARSRQPAPPERLWVQLHLADGSVLTLEAVYRGDEDGHRRYVANVGTLAAPVIGVAAPMLPGRSRVDIVWAANPDEVV